VVLAEKLRNVSIFGTLSLTAKFNWVPSTVGVNSGGVVFDFLRGATAISETVRYSAWVINNL